MSKLLDTVLLLALPASGKSEVRKYLDGLSGEQCRTDFGMGETVQLDDYPYVHLMHRIDDEMARRGQPYVFFRGPDRPFIDNVEWGTLIEMLNEDYADLRAQRAVATASAGHWMMDRLDEAHAKVGAPRALGSVPYRIRCQVAEAIEEECAKELKYRNKICSSGLEGERGKKTIFMEAARGGPHGSAFPLTPPHGYQYSFSRFTSQVLERASILYIRVSPEESRRKNLERARPDGQGTILHHSVPMEVMLGEYGCDDMAYLMSQSDRPGTVRIERPEIVVRPDGTRVYEMRRYYMPVGIFDNEDDKTSFIRNKKREEWTPEEIFVLHEELRRASEALRALR